MFKIYDEPETPNHGACLRYMMNRAFNIYDESKSPHEGACLRYVMNRNHQMRITK